MNIKTNFKTVRRFGTIGNRGQVATLGLEVDAPLRPATGQCRRVSQAIAVAVFSALIYCAQL